VCRDDEQCSAGACLAKPANHETQLGDVTRSGGFDHDNAGPTIAARASGIYQYWKISGMTQEEDVSVGYAGVAGGIEIAVERLHALVIPRLAVVASSGDTQVELGIDFGARFSRPVSNGRLGVDALITPMLFPGVSPNGQGFYYGGRAEVFFESGRLHVLAGFGYGHIAIFEPDARVYWYELGISLRL
jgi:hypothetical protein